MAYDLWNDDFDAVASLSGVYAVNGGSTAVASTPIGDGGGVSLGALGKSVDPGSSLTGCASCQFYFNASEGIDEYLMQPAWADTVTGPYMVILPLVLRSGTDLKVASFSDVDGSSVTLATVAGVLPNATTVTVRTWWQMSTTGSDAFGNLSFPIRPPGATDGALKVWVDDVLVVNLTGLHVVTYNAFGANRHHADGHYLWNRVTLWDNNAVSGYLDNLGIGTCATQPTTFNQSVACCGAQVTSGAAAGGAGTAGPVLGPDPFAPLPDWVASCAGGGDFPDGTDDSPAEVWD